MEGNEKRKLVYHLVRDFGVITLSIFCIIFAERLGLVDRLISYTEGVTPLMSFLAGVFFTSAFTAIPATVVFVELANDHSIILISFFGGLGALCGDYIIFRFVRDTIVEDMRELLQVTGTARFSEIFKRHLFRHLAPFVGALLIASPLPDEIGIALLGLSGTSTRKFAFFSFFLNAIGIAIVGFVGRALVE